MSITRLYTENLQGMADRARQARSDQDRSLSEAKSLAYAADKRAQETAERVQKFEARIDEIDAMIRTLVTHYERNDERIEVIERTLIEVQERQKANDEIANVLREDQVAIGELLSSITLASTPRAAAAQATPAPTPTPAVPMPAATVKARLINKDK